MTPSKQRKLNRIILLGNECNISEAHEGYRVNYGRELLPGAVTGEGHLMAARPACPETAVQQAPQPGCLPGAWSFRRVPTKSYDPLSHPPRLRTQTFKTQREEAGKAAKWTN